MKKTLFKTGKFSLFLILFFSALCAGCSKKNDGIKFDHSDPLALNPGIEWVLIKSPYVACHESADYDSKVVTHFRKGDIMILEGSTKSKIDGRNEVWYGVSEGWIPSSAAGIYSNKLKAQTAAEKL